MRIHDDVLRVLSTLEIDGNAVRITGGQLERKLYERTNAVLEECGGKWNRKARAHLFPSDPTDLLDAVINAGEITTARDLGYFATPAWLVARMVTLAGIRPGMRVLEPSAGEGAIAVPLRDAGALVSCGELDMDRAAVLRAQGFDRDGHVVIADDFLLVQPGAPALPPAVDVDAIVRGEEMWRPVVGFEAYYEVSSHGRVRRLVTRKGYKAGTDLALARRVDGYLNVVLTGDGERASRLVHRLVAEAFLGPCPAGHQVNHKHPDGDRSRNWLSNLEYTTSGENNADQRAHRPADYAVAGRHPRSKLTLDDALVAKRRLAAGESARQIAPDLGVTDGTVWAIRAGRTWVNRIPLVDAVVANPPFGRQADIDHVRHALEFVRPGGRLVAVMSGGTAFRENRKAVGFRELVELHRGTIEDLPENTFAAAGTNVRTVLVTLTKAGA